MYKKVLFGLIGFALLSIVLVACTIKDTAAGSSGPVAKMGSSTFITTAITIKKGESVNLVDTTSSPHVISNGTWNGSAAQPGAEAGAPKVSNLNFGGNDSKAIGPFTTAGTFKFYCTIHPGMNLVVTVA
jgi:plastocyanin